MHVHLHTISKRLDFDFMFCDSHSESDMAASATFVLATLPIELAKLASQPKLRHIDTPDGPTPKMPERHMLLVIEHLIELMMVIAHRLKSSGNEFIATLKLRYKTVLSQLYALGTVLYNNKQEIPAEDVVIVERIRRSFGTLVTTIIRDTPKENSADIRAKFMNLIGGAVQDVTQSYLQGLDTHLDASISIARRICLRERVFL